MNTHPVDLSEQQLEHIWYSRDFGCLEDALISLGYSSRLGSQIDKCQDIIRLAGLLDAYRRECLKFEYRGCRRIEVDIVNNTLNPADVENLSTRPEIVKLLERKWRLKSTGDVHAMIANYRANKYTYGFGSDDDIKSPIRWGHLDVVKKMVETHGYDTKKVIRCAAKHGQLEIIKHFYWPGAENLAMYPAVKAGRLDVVVWGVLMGYDVNHDMMADLAAEYGHMDVSDYLRGCKRKML